MTETTYSIAELEEQTHSTRRTIHFYIQEKLLPPPDGAGASARYTQEHIVRLRLIAKMQKAHIRLTGIKEALDAMSFEEMQRLVDESGSARARWSFDAAEHWLQAERMTEPSTESTPPKETPKQRGSRKNYSLVSRPDTAQDSMKQLSVSEHAVFFESLKRKITLDASSWRRYTIADGIEISIRNDIEDKYGTLLTTLMEEFKRQL